MECPICLDVYYDPHMGGCGHTLCRLCLEGLVQRNVCPLCRKRTTFKRNFAFRDIVKAQRADDYARLEHKFNLNRIPAVFMDHLRESYADATLVLSRFDDESTISILKSVAKDASGANSFVDEMIHKNGTAIKLEDGKVSCEISADGQCACVVECNQCTYIVISRKKNPFPRRRLRADS